MALSFVLENAARDLLGDALHTALTGGTMEICDGAVDWSWLEI
jgi:hypothetical protein